MKVSLSGIKEALKDEKFRNSLPETLKPDLEAYLKNPSCPCHNSFLKKLLKEAEPNLVAYHKGEALDKEKIEKELAPSNSLPPPGPVSHWPTLSGPPLNKPADIPLDKPSLPPEAFACSHRSTDAIRTEKCRLCGMKDKDVPVYGCDLFGECTIHAAGIRGDKKLLPVCISCPHRTSIKEFPPVPPPPPIIKKVPIAKDEECGLRKQAVEERKQQFALARKQRTFLNVGHDFIPYKKIIEDLKEDNEKDKVFIVDSKELLQPEVTVVAHMGNAQIHSSPYVKLRPIHLKEEDEANFKKDLKPSDVDDEFKNRTKVTDAIVQPGVINGLKIEDSKISFNLNVNDTFNLNTAYNCDNYLASCCDCCGCCAWVKVGDTLHGPMKLGKSAPYGYLATAAGETVLGDNGVKTGINIKLPFNTQYGGFNINIQVTGPNPVPNIPSNPLYQNTIIIADVNYGDYHALPKSEGGTCYAGWVYGNCCGKWDLPYYENAYPYFYCDPPTDYPDVATLILGDCRDQVESTDPVANDCMVDLCCDTWTAYMPTLQIQSGSQGWNFPPPVLEYKIVTFSGPDDGECTALYTGSDYDLVFYQPFLIPPATTATPVFGTIIHNFSQNYDSPSGGGTLTGTVHWVNYYVNVYCSEGANDMLLFLAPTDDATNCQPTIPNGLPAGYGGVIANPCYLFDACHATCGFWWVNPCQDNLQDTVCIPANLYFGDNIQFISMPNYIDIGAFLVANYPYYSNNPYYGSYWSSASGIYVQYYSSFSGLQYYYYYAQSYGVSFEWEFGDGESSSDANPQHTYEFHSPRYDSLNPTPFTVTLTVTSATGVTATCTNIIEIWPLCCDSCESVDWPSSPADPSSYAWDGTSNTYRFNGPNQQCFFTGYQFEQTIQLQSTQTPDSGPTNCWQAIYYQSIGESTSESCLQGGRVPSGLQAYIDVQTVGGLDGSCCTDPSVYGTYNPAQWTVPLGYFGSLPPTWYVARLRIGGLTWYSTDFACTGGGTFDILQNSAYHSYDICGASMPSSLILNSSECDNNDCCPPLGADCGCGICGKQVPTVSVTLPTIPATAFTQAFSSDCIGCCSGWYFLGTQYIPMFARYSGGYTLHLGTPDDPGYAYYGACSYFSDPMSSNNDYLIMQPTLSTQNQGAMNFDYSTYGSGIVVPTGGIGSQAYYPIEGDIIWQLYYSGGGGFVNASLGVGYYANPGYNNGSCGPPSFMYATYADYANCIAGCYKSNCIQYVTVNYI